MLFTLDVRYRRINCGLWDLDECEASRELLSRRVASSHWPCLLPMMRNFDVHGDDSLLLVTYLAIVIPEKTFPCHRASVLSLPVLLACRLASNQRQENIIDESLNDGIWNGSQSCQDFVPQQIREQRRNPGRQLIAVDFSALDSARKDRIERIVGSLKHTHPQISNTRACLREILTHL
jgi:hypothetical protein